MTMLTLEYFGMDADEKTESMRNQLKGIQSYNFDDEGDYFIFYNINRIRSSGSFKTIEFDDDSYVVIESENFEIQ